MKRAAPWFLLVAMLVACMAPLSAAGTAPTAAAAEPSPAIALAKTVATVTGIAISPLLGTSALGAYQWVTAKDAAARARLPWYAHWSFFVPALLIVGICATKDSLGAMLPPGFKKPLDVLETIENKASGLVAAGAVIPLTMDTLSKLLTGTHTASAHITGGLAMIQAPNLYWLLDVLTVPFGIAVFAVVWMASHAINVLILLSPWGAIDAALKAARTALLGLLTASAVANPWVGAVLSIVIIIISYFVAGWAFRLTWFGAEFCWDYFTLRRLRFALKENENRLFAGGHLAGVPVRTYGRLTRKPDGTLEFFYRPWLVLPVRSVVVAAGPASLVVDRGLFFSTITLDNTGTLFLLPPRYHGHESELAEAYAMGGGVRDAGLRRAWGVLKELFGGSAARTQVV